MCGERLHALGKDEALPTYLPIPPMLCAPSARNAYIGSLSHNSFAKPKKKKSGGNKVVRNRSPSGSLGVFKETGYLKSDKVACSALLLKRPSCCSIVEFLVRVSIVLERTCEEF